VLASMRREGLISARESDELQNLIQEKIGGQQVKGWFASGPGARVYAEHPILCGSGQVLRPDRVIVEEHRVTVVDFKFGELEKEAYKMQVRTYMDQLESMGHHMVEGYLWYVMMDKIIKI